MSPSTKSSTAQSPSKLISQRRRSALVNFTAVPVPLTYGKSAPAQAGKGGLGKGADNERMPENGSRNVFRRLWTCSLKTPLECEKESEVEVVGVGKKYEGGIISPSLPSHACENSLPLIAQSAEFTSAMVRGHYLRDLVDDVRCAKGEEKKKAAFGVALKAFERELGRISRFAEAKAKSLDQLSMTISKDVAKLSSPHVTPPTLTYELRAFSEWYIPERRAVVKQLAGVSLSSRTRSDSVTTVVVDEDATKTETVVEECDCEHDVNMEKVLEGEVERDGVVAEWLCHYEKRTVGMATGRTLKPIRNVIRTVYKVSPPFCLMYM
ncbi:hypothetical protein HK097_006250 [Rhizophlyctis rosea]|uniref:Uncharacterized protein n=1 Tax=Rhizophlyctis rosea TaxID=64517 RepID=A0AAD5SDG4_9FUNG|nr:hypothetical protein HK097_006250 [Rhizophlyctis rosea]